MVPQTNAAHVVEIAVTGDVSQPGLRYPGYTPGVNLRDVFNFAD